MKTTYSLSVLALTLAGPVAAEPRDAPPSTPAGLTAEVYSATAGAVPPAPVALRASVYSRTAGEIFWQRSSALALGYEIRRDGTVLTTTDGTSHFDDTLASGESYVYEVIAIDREGRRSAPSAVTLRTLGDEAPTTAPAAPSGLRADVYSATAAELFWTRLPTSELSYEVFDGWERLATTEGTSYFDDALEPARSYTYRVIAIDREGRRSAPSSVTLRTLDDVAAEGPPDGADSPFAEPDPDGATVIARLGYRAARDLADDLVSGDYLSLYYDVDAALVSLLRESEGFPRGQDEAETGMSVTCPEGGRASGSVSISAAFDLVLDRCAIAGRTLSGRLAREVSVQVAGFGSATIAGMTFDGLSIDAGEAGSLSVTGRSTRTDARVMNVGCADPPSVVRRVDNAIETARIETGADVRTVLSATWKQSDEPGWRRMDEEFYPWVPPCRSVDSLTFEGAASVTSTLFGTGVATLAKRGEFVRVVPRRRVDDISVATGRLAADFGDGSSLAVTTTSDERDEVQVDIVSDGAAVSFADTYRFEAREDVPAISGSD